MLECAAVSQVVSESSLNEWKLSTAMSKSLISASPFLMLIICKVLVLLWFHVHMHLSSPRNTEGF